MKMSRDYFKGYQKVYYNLKKESLIKRLGGKCINCGSIENLQFDHKESKTKKFSITKFLNFKWETVLLEVDKCQLLCFKCHKEKTILNKEYSKKILYGEQIGNSKLKNKQVIEILSLIKCGEGPRSIARKYGVSRHLIHAIKTKRIWKHITEN